MKHYIHTFNTAEDFCNSYNKGFIGLPYVIAIKDIVVGTKTNGEPLVRVLYSNRIPWKGNNNSAPSYLKHKATASHSLIGACYLN